MPILEKVAGAVGLSLTQQVLPPGDYLDDFPSGLEVVEIVDGKERPADKLRLVGAFMPHIPFKYGGTQQIVKEYYAGSSEPTVQVLGPRESDTVVRGTLKTKNLLRGQRGGAVADLRQAALEFQELIDAMRIRGNLVKITLGEWRRYGFIEEVSFDLRRVSDIDYEIKFAIIGFNPPTNCKITNGRDDDLIAPNKNLTNKATELLAAARNYPTEMPLSISDLITNAVGEVAEVVHLATSFIDEVVQDSEKLLASVNRAIGLLKYARAYISATSRRIGSISLDVASLGAGAVSEADKTVALIKNLSFIHSVQAGQTSLQAQLAALQAKFAGLAGSEPMFRHLVVEGETLQKIAIKHYNNADQWKKIYDHNKLQATALTAGTILEIPRL